jgi:hypothetical protein
MHYDRARTMQVIDDLEKCFPIYGKTISLEDESELVLKFVSKEDVLFSDEVSDDGKIKMLGELLITVTI